MHKFVHSREKIYILSKLTVLVVMSELLKPVLYKSDLL